MTWDPRKYGSREDPIHQSDVSTLMGGYGCLHKFALYKRYEAEHGHKYEGHVAQGRRELGTAAHATIARALTRPESRDAILRGRLPSDTRLGAVLDEEFVRACKGRPVQWGKTERQLDELRDAVAMVRHAFTSLAERASELVLVEAYFLAPLEAGRQTYWIEGTVDLAFHTTDGELALADWKTGMQRPHPEVLHRGFQIGLYAYALQHGTFRVDGREFQVGEYPAHMHIVHLRDFVPYKKKTPKRPSTREEADFYGVDINQLIRVEAGGLRGPGWYRSHRRADDHADMVHSLRSIVGTVRMGRTWKSIGESCVKCPFRDQCKSDGYGPALDEKRHLDRLLEDIDPSALPEVA